MRSARAVTAGVIIGALAVGTLPAGAQTGATSRARQPARQTTRAATAPSSALRTDVPTITCPAPLGTGVRTRTTYCDVLAGRDPAAGVRIPLPPHRGDVVLTFTLHNRHTWSEDQATDPTASYARYNAVIGVLTDDNTLIARAAIQSEFRTARDFVERIGGGAGPSGVKAVAPTGAEPIRVVIPEAEQQVSLLGEKLLVQRADGAVTYTSEGRPLAVVSNIRLQYRPAPTPAAPTRTRRR